MITLKTLPQATAQEVFDQVVNHLLTQNQACMSYCNNVYTCSYKNDEGLKCAAGCFVADEDYHCMMEGKSWKSLVEMGLAPEAHQTSISSYQKLHDEYSPEQWKNLLEEYAKMHALDFNYAQ